MSNQLMTKKEYGVYLAARKFMEAAADSVFRSSVYDYQECADCPDIEDCAVIQDVKERYDIFMREMEPHIDEVARELTHLEIHRRKKKKKERRKTENGRQKE